MILRHFDPPSMIVIATVVKNPPKYKKAEVNKALEKLEKCYNIDHDPRSDQYKKDRLEQFQKLSDYEDKFLVSNVRFSSLLQPICSAFSLNKSR